MKNILLALFGGLLLAFSWPDLGFSPIVFFAFVPLLIIEKGSNNIRKVFLFSFFSFLIFNVITTYWVWNSTPAGSIVAFLVNASLMATTFTIYSAIKRSNNNYSSNITFIVCWLTFEYLHLNWDLSWPWLTIGNVFAKDPHLVQWYEYTGVLGGSLWILLINIIIFDLVFLKYKKRIFQLLFFLIVPILTSLYIYYKKFEIKNNDKLNILIVQPNIDPYTEKFNIGYKDQLNEFVELSKKYLTDEIDLLIGPETALQEDIWENRINSTFSIKTFRELQIQYPNLNILVGASTYKLFEKNEEKSSTARQIRGEDIFYDAYNSAVFISSKGNIEIYHKTKLVPGAEKMPFSKTLDFLSQLMLDLGGISGSLGSSNNIERFQLDDFKIKPLICYESVYGDINNGITDLIAIITNDGWWGNTLGHRQHLNYSRLRAIEQRKNIVRSANTGISAVIDQKGNIVSTIGWDQKSCLTASLSINTTTTFYSKYGDYIGRLSCFIAVILILMLFVKTINKDS